MNLGSIPGGRAVGGNMLLVVTNKAQSFARYCRERNLDLNETRWIQTERQVQGWDRDTEVVFTNGYNQLGYYLTNMIRKRYKNNRVDIF